MTPVHRRRWWPPASRCSGWVWRPRSCSQPLWRPPTPCWPARSRWPNPPTIPTHPDEDEARFALTSEAGLNDGLAFPFTYLALAVAAAGALSLARARAAGSPIDLGWRLIAGLAVGLLVGWMLRRLFFNTTGALAAAGRARRGLRRAGGDVPRLRDRRSRRGLRLPRRLRLRLHHPRRRTLPRLPPRAAQLGRTARAAPHRRDAPAARRRHRPRAPRPPAAGRRRRRRRLPPGGPARWPGWLGLVGGRTGPRERAVIAFFGVRGIGSLFYIAYALGHGHLRPGRPAVGHRRAHRGLLHRCSTA